MLQALRNSKDRLERRARRRQQPHGLRHGLDRLEGVHPHAQGDRLRRRADRGVRGAGRSDAGQPVQERARDRATSSSRPRNRSSCRPRQRQPVGRVLHVARGRDDQDAAEEHVSATRSTCRTFCSSARSTRKGPEIAYLRDRIAGARRRHHRRRLRHSRRAARHRARRDARGGRAAGGTTIEALRNAGSRGKAVHGMLPGCGGSRSICTARAGSHGVATLGGAEGAVLGASAMHGPPDRRAQGHRHADRLGASAVRPARRHQGRDGRALGHRHPRAQPDQPRPCSTTWRRRSPAWRRRRGRCTSTTTGGVWRSRCSATRRRP